MDRSYSGIGNAFSGVLNQANEISSRSDLQELADDIETAIKVAAEINQALLALRDRMYGDRPTGQGDAQKTPRPVRGGMIGALRDRAEDLNATLARTLGTLPEIQRAV